MSDVNHLLFSVLPGSTRCSAAPRSHRPPVQVNGLHRCTPAHSYTYLPPPRTHNILCVLCPFSLGPCSVEATVCVSRLFTQTHTHKKKGAKPFEILSTAHLPCSLSRTNGRLFSLTWPRRGRRYRLEQRSPPHPLEPPTSRTSPTLLSPLTDPPRQTFFQVVGVEGGRGGCSKVFRLCEHAQEAFSRPPCPRPPPHPHPIHRSTPPVVLQLGGALLTLPTPHHLQLQLRQFSSNHEAGTFNLTECSRHLNYLTVVLVRGGGGRGGTLRLR